MSLNVESQRQDDLTFEDHICFRNMRGRLVMWRWYTLPSKPWALPLMFFDKNDFYHDIHVPTPYMYPSSRKTEHWRF